MRQQIFLTSAHHNVQRVPWFVTRECAVAPAVEDIKVAAFTAMQVLALEVLRIYMLCKGTVCLFCVIKMLNY